MRMTDEQRRAIISIILKTIFWVICLITLVAGLIYLLVTIKRYNNEPVTVEYTVVDIQFDYESFDTNDNQRVRYVVTYLDDTETLQTKSKSYKDWSEFEKVFLLTIADEGDYSRVGLCIHRDNYFHIFRD